MAINYGTTTFNGETITLTDQAQALNYGTDGAVRYYAPGTLANGTKVEVAWVATQGDDESLACDWDSPVAVREV